MTDLPTNGLPENPGEFIRAIRRDPDTLIPLLLNRDPRIKYVFKRRKKISIPSPSEEAIKNLLTKPEYSFNRKTWISLKDTLLCSPTELAEKTGCPFRESPSQSADTILPEADFFLWLLQEGGISPHHCRQLLLMEIKICKTRGISVEKRSPCDVLFQMNRLLRKNRGGVPLVFHVSRLWWIYTKNTKNTEKMASQIFTLTRL